jgi:O-antigen/teichoic acid export membrane protein
MATPEDLRDAASFVEPAAPVSMDARIRSRFELSEDTNLRQHAARGVVINSIFDIGLGGLGLIRGLVLAALVSTSDYGIWGILAVAFGTLLWLKQAGIGDKYIQQDEEDQELAFQTAFTLEAAFSGMFMVLIAIVAPIAGWVYGRPELVLPGFLLMLMLPAAVLQSPLWILYRRMNFARQRTLQAIDPIVSFVVAVVLAVAGAGYWSFIFGLMAGSYSAAVVSVILSPYKLRFRYQPGSLRRYTSFSWPLMLAGASGLVIAQTSTLLGEKELGLAGVGALALASNMSQFANRVDQIVSGTMYPAICAVQDRVDLLYESFVKSNRLALMWAVPFGLGLALFSPDLVRFGIGNKWHDAVPILQAFGAAAAIAHLGFNWDSYFRARGDTRPIGIAAMLAMIAFLATAIPLLYAYGLKGFVVGIVFQSLVHLVCRLLYLRKLFGSFDVARHASRAIAPSIPAAASVGVMRLLEPRHRSASIAVAEIAIYLVVTLLATVTFERPLLREIGGYLRQRAATA